MAIYYRICDKQGSKFEIDRWDGGTIEDWCRKITVSKNKLPPSASVGDVLKNHPRTATADIEFANEEITTELAELTEEYECRLQQYAEEYDVDLDTKKDTLEDGDVVLISMPNEPTYFDCLNGTAYAFPEGGVISDNAEFGLDPSHLINCSEQALETGMTFDVLEDDARAYGLRFNGDLTAEIQNKPTPIRITEDPFESGEIDSKADFERPIYVNIDGFDDGQYYSGVYDSADPPPQEYFTDFRYIAAASAYPPYKIREKWAEADLVEAEEIYIGENQYADYSVVVIPWDADVIEDAHKKWTK